MVKIKNNLYILKIEIILIFYKINNKWKNLLKK